MDIIGQIIILEEKMPINFKAIARKSVIPLVLVGAGVFTWYMLKGRHVSDPVVEDPSVPSSTSTYKPTDEDPEPEDIINPKSSLRWTPSCYASETEISLQKIITAGTGDSVVLTYAPTSVTSGVKYRCTGANQDEVVLGAKMESVYNIGTVDLAKLVYVENSLPGLDKDEGVVEFLLIDKGTYRLTLEIGKDGSSKTQKTRELIFVVGDLEGKVDGSEDRTGNIKKFSGGNLFHR
jgi:hypothetical protein